jgi:hypothetical protein
MVGEYPPANPVTGGGPSGFRASLAGDKQSMSPDDEPRELGEPPAGEAASPRDSAGSEAPTPAGRRDRKGRGGNMLPGRERRRLGIERLLVRLVATAGIIGIGVALAAILVSSKVQGWITGLVVAAVSVVLSAILWSSRQL